MYTFKKCNPKFLPDNRWNLLNINDMDMPEYTKEECLTIGRVIACFGEPDYTTEDMEDLYSCAVSATEENGETVYLEIYFGGCHIDSSRPLQKLGCIYMQIYRNFLNIIY